MQKKYDYSASTFDAQAHVDELNREICDHCEGKPLADEAARELLMAKLLRRVGVAAFNSASNREGGPFGAMLVDFNTDDGVPKVVGFGTNHVVPMNDPSAHAEMTAIRDASARLGKTDMSGLTLITSCECCPMCLSAATGCKVDQVYFAATREDAAKVGFSDEDQYRLMKAGGIEQHASKTADPEAAERKLLGHDAVVEVRHNNHVFAYFGDYDKANPNDPTDLPVVQAIKKACADVSRLRSEQTGKDERVFHLPEDTTIISRDMPHPMSLVTADWARIGRVRGENPEEPAQDAQDKDTSRIQYINDQFESMQVVSPQGKDAVDAQRVWDEIRNPSAMHKQDNLGRARTIAFEKWDALVNNNEMPRY
jgi:guanine deaminase